MNLFADTETTNVVDLLRNDHAAVKLLFQEFQAATDDAARKRIAEKAIRELIQHAGAEEAVFYPAVRGSRRAQETGEIMDEALEEHHAVELLLRELQRMEVSDPRYRAKFIVMAEMVKHHAREEEAEVFPLARTSSLDLEKLGRALIAAKGRALERWDAPARSRSRQGGKRPDAKAARRSRTGRARNRTSK